MTQDYKNLDTSNHIITSQFWIDPFCSPINFTSINIKTYSVSNGIFSDTDTIDLVIGDDENAIVYYWNLRALREKAQFNKTNSFGRRVLLLPLQILHDDVSFNKFFNEIRNLLPPQKNCNLNICIVHIPPHQTLLFNEKIKTLDFVKKFDDKVNVKLGKSVFEDDKLTYDFRPPLWFGHEAFIGAGSNSSLVQDLNISNNQVTYIPPKGFTNNYFQSVIIDVISDLWKSYPKSHLVAEKVRNSSYFSKYGLTSFSLARRSSNSFEFNLLDDWTKLKLFFEEKGYEIKPSKITTYSTAIIKLLGGIKNLNNLYLIYLIF